MSGVGRRLRGDGHPGQAGLRRRPRGVHAARLALRYSLQAGLFFSALTRIDAGLASLLLYAYPAFVTVAAIALRREQADRRRMAALGVSLVGVALV